MSTRLRLTNDKVLVNKYDIGDAIVALRISKDANFTEVQIDLDGTDVIWDGQIDQFKVNNIYLPQMLNDSFEESMANLLRIRGYLVDKDPNFVQGETPVSLDAVDPDV